MEKVHHKSVATSSQGLLTFQHGVRKKISHVVRLCDRVFTPAAVIIISEIWHQRQ